VPPLGHYGESNTASTVDTSQCTPLIVLQRKGLNSHELFHIRGCPMIAHPEAVSSKLGHSKSSSAFLHALLVSQRTIWIFSIRKRSDICSPPEVFWSLRKHRRYSYEKACLHESKGHEACFYPEHGLSVAIRTLAHHPFAAWSALAPINKFICSRNMVFC
jgi:hypothetical protein